MNRRLELIWADLYSLRFVSEEEQVPRSEAESVESEERLHFVSRGLEHDDTQVLRGRSVGSHRRKLH